MIANHLIDQMANTSRRRTSAINRGQQRVVGPPCRDHLALNRAEDPRQTSGQRLRVNHPSRDNGPVGDVHHLTVHDPYGHRVVIHHHHAASPVGQMDTSTSHTENESAATNPYPSP